MMRTRKPRSAQQCTDRQTTAKRGPAGCRAPSRVCQQVRPAGKADAGPTYQALLREEAPVSEKSVFICSEEGTTRSCRCAGGPTTPDPATVNDAIRLGMDSARVEVGPHRLRGIERPCASLCRVLEVVPASQRPARGHHRPSDACMSPPSTTTVVAVM
jgi:hypothetical protein